MTLTLDQLIDRLTAFKERLHREFPGIIVSEYPVVIHGSMDGGVVRSDMAVDSMTLTMSEGKDACITINLVEI